MTPEEEIAALRAENAALREQVQVLLARVQALEGRLAKDRHSGRPRRDRSSSPMRPSAA